MNPRIDKMVVYGPAKKQRPVYKEGDRRTLKTGKVLEKRAVLVPLEWRNGVLLKAHLCTNSRPQYEWVEVGS